MKKILLLATVVMLVTACNKAEDSKTQLVNSIATPTPEFVETEIAQLETEDVLVGDGQEAQEGDTVSVHYVGTLESGEQFDSSRDRGTPFEFTIGTGSVIQGWEQGIPGMKVGGIRILTIPPELGYGAFDRPGIPANSTLIFEVELLEIK